MFHTFNVTPEVVALYETRPEGSEVLLFKRNEGLLGRINVPEKGDAVEQRLARSFEHIRKAAKELQPQAGSKSTKGRST
jgi:hypothetical protein